MTSLAGRLLRSPALRRRAVMAIGGLGLAVALVVGALIGAGAVDGGSLVPALVALALAGGAAGAVIGARLIDAAESARQVRDGFWISRKLEPLALEVSDRAPVRINIVHPSIDLKHFFGGFIAVFNLAARLAARGHAVRLITLEQTDLPADWQDRVSAYEGLGDGIEGIEVESGTDPARPVEVNPADTLIATHWTAAHVAAEALPVLAADRFLYLIQEYEPFTFPMGSAAALARQSYDLPHTAMFSTGLLRDFFARNRIGVFRKGADPDGETSITFENAITPVTPPTRQTLDRPGPRRLVFYARPEQHASRNLFELGMMALDRALANGHFEGWDLVAVGSVDLAGTTLPLRAGTRSLRVIGRTGQAEHADQLAGSDLGLALMHTPHPSLVPIEMASAGMVTVTNTFENKNESALAGISDNLIAAEPTVEAVAAALAVAESRVEDLEARIRGSRTGWPNRWEDALGEEQLSGVERLLGATDLAERRGRDGSS
ncbi:MAG: hypothetical protein M9938_00940 [Solirubrobacterales bacterium]|nr:hypothetical protein [Solirubrobacterales bacterium]